MKPNIVHELNNALVIVSGNLELIERRIGDDPETKIMIESALAAIHTAKELAQTLALQKKLD